MASAQAPQNAVLDFSFNAGANMSSTSAGPGPQTSYQYTAVKATANDLEVAPSSSAGSRVLGVLQTQPLANQAATVRLLGISKLVVDGSGTAIAPGDMLATDASGRGVKSTSTGAETFAQALQGSSALNDIISVHVIPGQRF